MDVARAVGEDLGRPDANDALGAGELGQQGILLVDRRDAVQAQARLAVEVDEEQADAGVREKVAEREEHSVPVVARKRERLVVEHAYEAWVAALVRALWRAVRVGRCEEEHVAPLDERTVLLVDRSVDENLLDPVGETARVETVLEAPAAVVIEAHAEIMRRHAPEIHVAAIGDSITAGSPWDDDPSIGWPAAAAEADPRLRFTVRAVYGKRTDEIAAWLDEAAAGAEVLVVQGGINDIAQGRAVADAAANLRTMIQRGRELGLRVAVANVLPWNNGWPRAEASIRELNALIEGMGVPVLPFHETLEDPEQPGRMRDDWTFEGDHPSIAGYRLLGELAFRLP